MRATAQELVLASAKKTMEEAVFGVGEGGVGGGNAAASAVVGMVAPRRPLASCRLGDSGAAADRTEPLDPRVRVYRTGCFFGSK
jgi:hypothetical protein